MSSRDSDASGSETTGSSANHGGTRQLPPIHTVLGDQLALPTLPSSYSPHSASSRESTQKFFWHPRDRGRIQKRSRSPSSERKGDDSKPQPSATHSASTSAGLHDVHSLPPPPPRNESELSSVTVLTSAHSFPPSPSPLRLTDVAAATSGDGRSLRPPPWAHPLLPNSAPPYSYNILRPSPSGELITAPSVSRRGRHAGASGATTPHRHHSAPGSSALPGEVNVVNQPKRHVCPICLKRFNRPSSLKTHQNSHTGMRPFPCNYPGCSKVFSVASNMRRHRLKHNDTVVSGSSGAPGLEHDSLASGSSEGEPDMDVDEEPLLASASTSISASTPTSASTIALTPAPASAPLLGDYRGSDPHFKRMGRRRGDLSQGSPSGGSDVAAAAEDLSSAEGPNVMDRNSSH